MSLLASLSRSKPLCLFMVCPEQLPLLSFEHKSSLKLRTWKSGPYEISVVVVCYCCWRKWEWLMSMPFIGVQNFFCFVSFLRSSIRIFWTLYTLCSSLTYKFQTVLLGLRSWIWVITIFVVSFQRISFQLVLLSVMIVSVVLLCIPAKKPS